MEIKRNVSIDLNFSLITSNELEGAVDGIVVCNFALQNMISGIVVDSRLVRSNFLFIPLRGENQDGHSFIEASLKNGAVCFFSDFKFIATEKNKDKIINLCKKYCALCISVNDTLKALQDLAGFYLQKFPNLYKIGITGSSGKTTTKEILGSIYAQKYKTIMNEGNLNSETGLPLSIFKIRKEHQVGIFELGMNRKNEIAELAAVLSPNAAIITNIGTAHIGILGTKQEIAEQKKQIFLNFNESCIGFIPDCEFTGFLKNGVKGVIKRYSENRNIKKIEQLGFEGSKILYKDVEINFPLVGKYNLKNAIACINFAEEKNFSAIEIKTGLEAVLPLFGRSQVKHGLATYLLDCYNANPESMSEALNFCNSVKIDGDKHFVIGSMLELGKESGEAHKKVIKKILNSDVQFVYFYGDEFYFNKNYVNDTDFNLKNIFYFKKEQFENLKRVIKNNLKQKDFILLKGSRSLELERLEIILTDKEERCYEKNCI